MDMASLIKRFILKKLVLLPIIKKSKDNKFKYLVLIPKLKASGL